MTIAHGPDRCPAPIPLPQSCNLEGQLADPLNPYLYSLLVQKFKSVKVANEGVPAYVTRYQDPMRPGRTVTRASCWGEYYRVSCPFCDDNDHKLWINHRYGADVSFGKRTDLHLAVCYKHECLSVPGNQEKLAAHIFGGFSNVRKAPIKVIATEYVPTPVSPPGLITALTDLPPQHSVIQYLQSRRFDPAYLETAFGVGFCDPHAAQRFDLVRGRIYIPVVFNGDLVGWQARYVGESAYAPKYFNEPGMKKSRILYNYDRAKDQPFVVVVEGVPSVWRIGAPAVCMFGKSMSLFQQSLISSTWGAKPVFLMLDNDAKTEINQALAVLAQKNVQAIPVYLPDSRDPADYSREDIAEMLRISAYHAGIQLDMSMW